jgi:hypothetical protein
MLQWRSGESHENLSAGDADRYPPDRDSLHFRAKTGLQQSSAITGSPDDQAFGQPQGLASGNIPFPARIS